MFNVGKIEFNLFKIIKTLGILLESKVNAQPFFGFAKSMTKCLTSFFVFIFFSI